MSKKSGRRRSSRSSISNAAVPAQLSDISVNLDGPSGHDPILLASQTSKILSLASLESSERKALMHRTINGLSTLLKALKIAEDPVNLDNILSVLAVLVSHKYTGTMIRGGVVSTLMGTMVQSFRCPWFSKALLIKYIHLLNKFSSRDKKFSLKGRLSGLLPIVAELFKKYLEDQEVLVEILVLLTSLSTNGRNAECLGKMGCIGITVKLLAKVGHSDLLTAEHCVAILMLLFKQKSNVSRQAAQNCVKQLLSLHERLHRSDHRCRHIAFRKKILNCLLVCISSDANLQMLNKCNGLDVLYSTAKESSEGSNKALYTMASQTCKVLRRCLPPIPLPLNSLENPTPFPLPPRQIAYTKNLTSTSSSTKTTTSDLSHQTKSNGADEDGEEGEMTSRCSAADNDVTSLPLEDKVPVQQYSCNDLGDDTGEKDPTLLPSVNRGEVIVDTQASDLQIQASAQASTRSDISSLHLEQFKKYFPELEELHVDFSSSRVDKGIGKTSSLELDTKADTNVIEDLEDDLPAVIIPTGIAADKSEDMMTQVGSSSRELKNVTGFVEIPIPQVYGHLPPDYSEPFYFKSHSIDRKLYLSDIGRVVNPWKLTNRTVFDLDLLLAPPSTPESHSTQQASAITLSEEVAHLNLESKEIREDLKSEVTESSSSRQSGRTNKSSSDDTVKVQDHLRFESRFESGNLRKAIQVRQYEYDLLLNSDINTNHHHQWFFFKVTNTTAKVSYRFNIINCEKPNSQFNYGMQPLIYSTTDFRLNQRSWVRTGTNVSYYSNNHVFTNGSAELPSLRRKRKSKKSGGYYTLTFSVEFQYNDDICYFAYHYPYTYTMLQNDLNEIEAAVSDKDLYYHRQPLCTTLCGNICPLVTITSKGDSSVVSQAIEGSENGEEKKYIVLSARVHPGESNSSWVMRGLLFHLTSTHPNAQFLRDRFVFKIIPMLNPDGVIHGSHRCSLSGEDLNRQWIFPDPVHHSTIYSTKALLQWLVNNNRKPEVYCDFHGHSRKKNIFMYGCKDPSGLKMEQALPHHLDQIAPLFNYSNCNFSVEKSKEATARVVVWKELGVTRSYTMESTYCGADQGNCNGRQIGTRDLEEMGAYFCEGLQLLEEQSVSMADYDSTEAISEGKRSSSYLSESISCSKSDEDTASSHS